MRVGKQGGVESRRRSVIGTGNTRNTGQCAGTLSGRDDLDDAVVAAIGNVGVAVRILDDVVRLIQAAGDGRGHGDLRADGDSQQADDCQSPQ